MSQLVNIARFLPQAAVRHPERTAIAIRRGEKNSKGIYDCLTFHEVETRCNQMARALQSLGIVRGMRVLLAVRPGLDFVPLAFALFKIGAVPVMIDPGMGKSNLLDCVKQVRPEAVIGIPKALIASWLKRDAFSSVKIRVLVGSSLPLLGVCLHKLYPKHSGAEFPLAQTTATETAAIVFTTGSTGAPKGVVYFHEQMEGQLRLIRDRFSICDNDVDLPVFPLFALFAVAWGIKAVIPDMDPTRPAEADGRVIVQEIQDHQVTFSIGSPAFWDTLGQHCLEKGEKLSSLRQILMIGAPVRPSILQKYEQILSPQAHTYTPYGATEALPVATLTGAEILADTAKESAKGLGTCVGYPFPEVEIGIVPYSTQDLTTLKAEDFLPVGSRGEVVVSGPIVTKEYLNRPDATRHAKVVSEDGRFWHRMGDMGYLDRLGRLWFCGRKNHMVIQSDRIYYSVCCEAIFNAHAAVARTALVGINTHDGVRPVIMVEPRPGHVPATLSEESRLFSDLLALGQAFEHTKDIELFMIHQKFPVDIRHNAKIFREKLAEIAQAKFGGHCGCHH